MSEHDFKPITSADFILPATHGVKRSVGASINKEGALVIDGLDWGELAHSMLGGDYEYSVTVKPEFKDSVLLLLLKEHFKDFPEAKKWLEEQGIPFINWTWG